jgi:hypothetical protein
LQIIAKSTPSLKDTARKLWQEAHELQLIFVAIVKKSRNNKNANNFRN